MNRESAWPESLDALAAAPRSHKLLLDHRCVRVLEIAIEPGVKEPEHTHRWPSVMIVDRPARIRYYERGRLVFESPSRLDDRPVPRVEWLAPEGPHAVENIDEHSYHAFRVEMHAPELGVAARQ
jgi:hypothetical protein